MAARLINKLLQDDPEKRPNVHQVLEDDFFQGIPIFWFLPVNLQKKKINLVYVVILIF